MPPSCQGVGAPLPRGAARPASGSGALRGTAGERPEDRASGAALGGAIRDLREGLGLSRRELAQRAELSYSYLTEIENGDKEPAYRTLRQIAVALGLPVEALIADSERLRTAAEQPPPPSAARAPVRGWFEGPLRRRGRRTSAEETTDAARTFELSVPSTALDEAPLSTSETLRHLEVLVPQLSEPDRRYLLELARRLARR